MIRIILSSHICPVVYQEALKAHSLGMKRPWHHRSTSICVLKDQMLYYFLFYHLKQSSSQNFIQNFDKHNRLNHLLSNPI